MAWTEVSAVYILFSPFFGHWLSGLKIVVYFMYTGILIIHWKIWKIFFWLQKQKIVSTKTTHFILEITFEPCKNAEHLWKHKPSVLALKLISKAIEMLIVTRNGKIPQPKCRKQNKTFHKTGDKVHFNLFDDANRPKSSTCKISC